MIGAILHRLLNPLVLRVPAKNLGQMSLYSVTDIPYWIIFRAEWIKFTRKLSAFQKNLGTREWSSLGMVYPRLGVLAYGYYLFSWADYCGQTDRVISHPDDTLFAEVFLSYICQIDMLIDKRDSLYLWEGDHINEVKLTKNIAATAGELCGRVDALPIPRERKHLLIKRITGYRRNALNAMRRHASSGSQSFEEILEDKKDTACSLLPEWSRLLSTACNVPDEMAIAIQEIFLNFSFLVQIIDDIADAPADHRNRVQNIFIALVQQNEMEWVRLQEIIAGGMEYIGWRWIRVNLPVSYQGIKQLYNEYAARLMAGPYKPSIARKMFSTIDSYRQLMELNQ